jgi:hypothetical protein
MPRKRKAKSNKSILEVLGQQVTSENKNAKFIINPQGQVSMSDAISQLIEPFRDDAPDFDSFRNLVTFACLAWNISVLPKEEQDEMMNKMIAKAPTNLEDRLDMLGLVTELIDRKKKLFPKVSRMIVDYKVTDRGKNFHIAIASTLETKDAQK